MKIISFNKVLKGYLESMFILYRQENFPGINDYCLILKDLLFSFFDFYREKITIEDIEIEILENARELQIYMPRIRIWNGKTKIYGYIDVLPPNSTIEEINSYQYLNLYRRVLSNLILTNFFEFSYYRGVQKVCTARPFSASHLGELTNKLKVKSKKLFFKELQHFMLYSDKKSKTSVPSFIRLQQQLALKTYYLKEYILTPFLNHLASKGIKTELSGIYRAYCYFFNLELSVKEFSAFLAHVIIDGFLRAGIFYSNINSNPGKPLSRCRVYKFAEFNRMPARRLAIFNYLSPGSGEYQLPVAVQWFMDEICQFLANIDFQKMCCFPWKNPMLIDGKILQLERYFFKPFYDSDEESRKILRLLKKEGLFSSVINYRKQKKWCGAEKNEAEDKKTARGKKI